MTGEPAVLGEVWHHGSNAPEESLRDVNPTVYSALVRLAEAAQQPVRRLVRIEGSEVELLREETLWLSVAARVRFCITRLVSGAMDADAFLRHFPPEALAPARTRLDNTEGLRLFARGNPCSTGCGTGALWPVEPVDGDDAFVVAVNRVEAHHTALLRNPRCAGLIATRGSPADHYALLSRETGFGYLTVTDGVLDSLGLHVGDSVVPFGTIVTIDFTEGSLYLGSAQLSPAADDKGRSTARSLLARKPSPVTLTVSVDAPDVLGGHQPGRADGIGIVRLEHLIRLAGLEDHLQLVLESERSTPAFVTALAEPLMRVLRLAGGLPVAVRLLDLPVSELPGRAADATDPTLGLRGVRQGVRWPHLYRAQFGALVAAARTLRALGETVAPLRVLVPMVCTAAEVRLVRAWAESEARAGGDDILVGAMLETPAALAEVEAIAGECEFALFGTNDLTSLCLGIGRTDYLSVIDGHLDRNLLEADPFDTFHPGVLRLVQEAAIRARETRPDIDLGLCGRHVKDPRALDLVLAGTIDHLCVESGDVDVVALQAYQRALL
ncbi:MAG TPA: putative PEP-binding protein [Nocardioidaceae bacterium]|nr:putative PEP-binding protein [Nocardioidaceae bacterium]